MKIINNRLKQFRDYFIELVREASNLEGIGLTYGQTKDIVDHFEKAKQKYSWEQVEIVSGVYKAYQYVLDIVNDRQPITYIDLQNINKLINKYETGIKAGSWRTEFVTIGGTKYVPPIYASQDYIARIEQTLSKPITFDDVVKLYADLCKMQSFKNGNKRSALVFCNTILITQDLDFIKVTSEKKMRDALVKYYENGTNYPNLLKLVKKWSLIDLNSQNNKLKGEDKVISILNSKLATKNMTETELALEVDVSKSYINKIFSSKKRPSVDVAKKIATVLNFNWEIFFE